MRLAVLSTSAHCFRRILSVCTHTGAALAGAKYRHTLHRPAVPRLQQTLDIQPSWPGAQDKTLSDSMEPVMAAMQLNALVRKAVGTAKGVRIRMDRQQFEMAVLSSILWFKARTISGARQRSRAGPCLALLATARMSA